MFDPAGGGASAVAGSSGQGAASESPMAGGGGSVSLAGSGGNAAASGSGGNAATSGNGGALASGGGGTGGTLVESQLTDGGLRDSGAAVEPAADAERSCAGTLLAGVCWYLAADGQSCSVACEAHDGFDVASIPWIGVIEQGGSLERCSQVLTALLGGTPAEVESGTRPDAGVGCHIFGPDQERWWLTEPAFDPNATLPGLQSACGCNA